MESVGIYAKTDPIDAKALRDYAETNAKHLQPFILPEPELKELQKLTRRRNDLVKLHTQEINRLQAPDNDCVRQSIKAVLTCVEKQMTLIEEKIDAVVQKSEELREKIDIMTAVKCVGDVTAVNLLVAMPELGHVTGKQAASLGGLAPFARDSGKKKRKRHNKAGRVDVRTALYMAALSAVRHNEAFKTFYVRLLKNGKLPLQALSATSRKLLVILNAKLRDAAKAKLHSATVIQTKALTT